MVSQNRTMNTKNILIGGFAIVSIIIVLYGAYVLTQKPSSTQQLNFYKTSSTERPKLKIPSKFKNIGEMKVSEDRTATFSFENTGKKPLQIYYGTTSCNCTFGQIKVGVNVSPVFGMHDNQDFMIEIAPKEKATLDVIYKPSLMPVYGKVTREAIIKTNDPENPEVQFGIEAYVK